MTTTAHISVREYLATLWRPDRDYIDGCVLERNAGTQLHSLVMGMLCYLFWVHRKVWGLRSLPGQRLQLSPTRFRIPDVCVISTTEPVHPILQTPPLLCVEILSPEDRFNRIQERVAEYLAMGVPHIWIIDPETRAVWTVSREHGTTQLKGDTLSLPGTPARITIAEIFEEIDEAPKD